MSDLGYEHGKDVIVNDYSRRPMLYDAKDRPLIREVGFRGKEKDNG